MALETIQLRGTQIVTSALGFGTTGLLALDRERDRIEILERAFDLGIRHYDTAPYYGYGEAEKVLGRFIQSRRGQVTLTTKFGIQPPRVAGLSSMAGVAKRLTRQLAPIRRFLAGQAGRLVQRGAFRVEDARTSLRASLRALGTDYIDVYLLHEAGPEETASEELLAFLNEQVRQGTIRSFGIGSEFDRTLGVMAQHPAFARVVQFENNVLRRNLERLPQGGGAAVVTHRALSDAFSELAAFWRANPAVVARCSAEAGADCADESVLGGLMLSYAVQANPAGVVLFSSRSRAHLERNVKVIADKLFSSEQIAGFVGFVARHITSDGKAIA
jgi:aryl-alcohol dehydrogenase-like predicted oxidoreductase